MGFRILFGEICLFGEENRDSLGFGGIARSRRGLGVFCRGRLDGGGDYGLYSG